MAGALLLLWAVLRAQTPDSAAHARYDAAIRRMSESLTLLEGSAAMFRADLINASPDLVISRATRLRQHCAGSGREAGSLDSLRFIGVRLRRELASLRAELARCEREFTVGPWYQGADSVKAWAPYRLARLTTAVRRFRLAAHTNAP
jgi:hypothetical protein